MVVLSLSLHVAFLLYTYAPGTLCVSQYPLLKEHWSDWIRAHPKGHIIIYSHFKGSTYKNSHTLEVFEVRTSTYEFGGDSLAHNICLCRKGG
jgi:hypothetical protein